MSAESESVSAPINTPFCGELRSKRYFMLDVIPTDGEQYLDASGYCWCYHTQQVLGPDGDPVGPDDCRVGRSCYRSALAADIEEQQGLA
ncbi:MAG: hypothetical protein JWM57_2126 [Phycisphaerales bacterium]|nr:hypothetical protein [Phycisphaerales bacterium]